jgi:hypothetical protein
VCAQCFDDSLIEIAQRIDHTQEDQPGAALSKADAQMASFVHVVHRVRGTATDRGQYRQAAGTRRGCCAGRCDGLGGFGWAALASVAVAPAAEMAGETAAALLPVRCDLTRMIRRM